MRTRTAYEHVRTTVRGAILDGTLSGGTHLVQSELATELGVSTTPVREALRDLAAEGLVVLDPHRGALVRALGMAEVREVYELRMVLEPIMVRRVVQQVTDIQLQRAEDLCDQMDKEADPGAWVALNRGFHGTLNEPDNGSRLAGILSGLRDSAAAYVAVSLDVVKHREEANSEHRKILEFYQRGDQDAAVEFTLQHMQSTLRVLEQVHSEGILRSVQ